MSAPKIPPDMLFRFEQWCPNCKERKAYVMAYVAVGPASRRRCPTCGGERFFQNLKAFTQWLMEPAHTTG